MDMELEPEAANIPEPRTTTTNALQRSADMADRNAWARAYAKQSRSDLAIYELFTSKEFAVQCPPLTQIEPCHALHYLQMACEKIAKAYRLRDTDTPIENLLTSHVAFSKFVTGFLKASYIQERYRNKSAELRHVTQIARLLAREIEILAPAVERETAPYNTEYPWADANLIVTPCEYSFPNVNLLRTSEGRNFLKIVKIAISNFEELKLK